MLNELNETTCKGKLREAGGMGLMVAVTPFDGSKEKQLALLENAVQKRFDLFRLRQRPLSHSLFAARGVDWQGH